MEGQIPERRPEPEELERMREESKAAAAEPAAREAALPVWRCKVCGYLCARERPPGKCPICGADRDRFEEFPL